MDDTDQTVGGQQGEEADDGTSFEALVRSVLRDLRKRFGMQMWMLARHVGDRWVLVFAEGDGFELPERHMVLWQDSMCSRMMATGQHVVPEVDGTPFADAANTVTPPVGAYAGVPVRRRDGSLFGTICAIGDTPLDLDPEMDEAMGLYGRLLSRVLEADLLQRSLEIELRRAQMEALRDRLTGLPNRRAFLQALEDEEERSRRYGAPASIAMIDLDGLKDVNDSDGHDAGDLLLRNAARALRQWRRETDVTARLGGDEFAVLMVETPEDAARVAVQRLRESFAERGVRASIGVAAAGDGTLQQALGRADAAMYADKRARRSDDGGSIDIPDPTS